MMEGEFGGTNDQLFIRMSICIHPGYHIVGGSEGGYYPSVRVVNPIAYQNISKEFHIDLKFPAFVIGIETSRGRDSPPIYKSCFLLFMY